MTYYGKIRKTHGAEGGLLIDLAREGFRALEPEFLFIEIEGIPVPFRLEELRQMAEGVVVKFVRIPTVDEADRYRGAKVFVEETDLPEGVTALEPPVGYELLDSAGESVGRITDLDETTANLLLTIERDEGSELLLPLVDEWLVAIDEEAETLTLDFPPELLEL